MILNRITFNLIFMDVYYINFYFFILIGLIRMEDN
jgi:hypothetical protein